MSTLELSNQLSTLHPLLKSFTRRFTTDRDESLDLVQDTILRALSYKHKFKENTNLTGWLFIIMRNTFINQYRKKKRERTSTDHTQNLFLLNKQDTYTFNSPHTTYEYHDLWSQINTLQDELLIPFKMHTSGYKYHEIAKIQKIPIGTVKNRIFTARKEIQKKLAG